MNTPGNAYGVGVSGTYAYVADNQFGLQVVDVADPKNPKIVGSRDTHDFAKDVAVLGDHVYVADYRGGVHVMDVSNPQSPQILGSIGTPDLTYSLAISDAHIYVADGYSGLEVIHAQCKWKKTDIEAGGRSSPGKGFVQARPNPAMESVSLRFAIPSSEIGSLRIHDVAGRHVRTLATDSRSSGEQDVMWDGRDDQGRVVASGTYFVRLQWTEGTATSRVMIIR